MLIKACLGCFLLTCATAWAQVDISGQDSPADAVTEVELQVPPPVDGGKAYSAQFTGDNISNFLRAGFSVTSAYNSNLWGGTTGKPVADESYAISPIFALDKTTPQLHLVVNYVPGFTVYQHTSAYNEFSQNLGLDMQYHMTPNLTLALRDTFLKSSNLLNQTNTTAITVSGSVPVQSIGVIAPVADQLSNTTNAQVTYQLDPYSMIGVTGNFGELYYPNPAAVSGL